MNLSDIQRRVGVTPDGKWGPNTATAIAKALGMTTAAPFDRVAFLNLFINKSAPAITEADLKAAAEYLNVPVGHIKMVKAVESGGASFDNSGRPIILFEPHIFYRQTGGAHGITSFSYPKWGQKPYPKSYDGRWEQLADAATVDDEAAVESASWGLFQVMGFHWKALGYESALEFALSMVGSEAGQLTALVKYIAKNGLAPALRRCKKGDSDSCRDFAKGYNGSGYTKNNYHIKMARAL